MNRFSILLITSGLLVLSSCHNQQANEKVSVEKTAGELFAEAYQNKDWETVVSVGDTLIGENDTMNLTIAYAEALTALGNHQKALIALDRKIAINPDDYYLYQTKGNVYYTMERFDSAIINYEHAITLKPTYARPYINKGEIYELLGDRDNAISSFLSAAKLFVSNDMYQEANEFGMRVLYLDSTNIEAKEIIDLVQQNY